MAAHDDKTRAQVERQLERYKKAREVERDSALLNLLATHEGRTFCWWLLELGGIGRQPFDGGANALRTAFNCGELNVGQQFLAKIIETDPASYVRMMQENQDDYRKHITADPTSSEPAGRARPGNYDLDGGPDTITDA